MWALCEEGSTLFYHPFFPGEHPTCPLSFLTLVRWLNFHNSLMRILSLQPCSSNPLGIQLLFRLLLGQLLGLAWNMISFWRAWPCSMERYMTRCLWQPPMLTSASAIQAKKRKQASGLMVTMRQNDLEPDAQHDKSEGICVDPVCHLPMIKLKQLKTKTYPNPNLI